MRKTGAPPLGVRQRPKAGTLARALPNLGSPCCYIIHVCYITADCVSQENVKPEVPAREDLKKLEQPEEARE